MTCFGNVIVEGNIGAGKSTLTSALARHLGGEAIFEPADGDNPFMPLYYADPKRWAFQMQIFLLSKRYRAHLYAQQKALCFRKDFVVLDRSYFGDACFARVQKALGFFNDAEFEAYFSLHKDMATHILYPSVVVYVKTSPKVCMERIAKRRSEKEGRACEAGIELAYLDALHNEIDRTVSELRSRGCRVLVLDYDEELSPSEIDALAEKSAREIERLSAHTSHESWTGLDCGVVNTDLEGLDRLARFEKS